MRIYDAAEKLNARTVFLATVPLGREITLFTR